MFIQPFAVVAQPVVSGALAPLPVGDIAPRRTSAVVVMHSIRRGFLGFVDGIKRSYFWHLLDLPDKAEVAVGSIAPIWPFFAGISSLLQEVST